MSDLVESLLNPKLLETPKTAELTEAKKADQLETEETLRGLIAEFQPIAESRRKLRETTEEVRGLITALTAKIDSLDELKRENLELEREVLTRIRAQL